MKTEVVRVRLTGMEKEKLMDHAEGMNMSMSDYIKYCCLVEPPLKIKEYLEDLEAVREARKGPWHTEEEVQAIFEKAERIRNGEEEKKGKSTS